MPDRGNDREKMPQEVITENHHILSVSSKFAYVVFMQQ